MKIRLANKEDVQSVATLWLLLIEETYPEETPSVKEFFRQTFILMDHDPGYSMLVAENDDGSIIGFVDGMIYDDPLTGLVCGRGRHMYVLPQYRSTAAGIMLFRAQEQYGLERGVRVMKVNCIPSIVPLYEKLGYKPIEFLMSKKIGE